jgi:type I restriction enzyme S subunit
MIDYIDLGAVDNEHKVVVGSQSVIGREAPSRARQKVIAGDILVSTVRPYLNGVARVPKHLDGATASTGFCILRPSTGKIDPAYLFQWVKSPAFVADMIRKSTGASYPAVSDRIICDSLVPLPSLPEQRRIAAILNQADALRRLRIRALSGLADLEQALFQNVFGDVVNNTSKWPDRYVLGDVADVASGITKGRKVNGQTMREVLYLAVSNVQDGHVRLDVVKTIEATEAEIARYRLFPGDLVLTEGGDPDKLGRGGIWHGEIEECIHQNHVFRVRITDAAVRPLFLSRLIGSQRGKRYFLRSAKQTTGIASINMTQLKNFPLLLPSISIQMKYEEEMEKLGQQKRRFESALAATEALFASLQHRAFRGEL